MIDASLSPTRIGCLLIDNFALMSFSSVVEPLRAANWLAGRTLYEIEYISASGGRITSSNGALIETTMTIESTISDPIKKLDILFVIAGGDPTSFHDSFIFSHLRQLSLSGVILGGVSGGPVILAAAGVMKGRRMTVHWEHLDWLREKSPNLLIDRTLYVIDRDRITCAGGIGPLDMMHALITQDHDADFARQVSDWFLHTEIRPSGSAQRAQLVDRYATQNQAVILAIEAMENHIADPLLLAQLARRAMVGTRQLNRLFKAELKLSTMGFYRQLRLHKARGLLSHSSLSITDIALATGFTSSAHFSSAFKQQFADTPSSTRH